MIHHEQEQVLCNEMRLSRLSKSAVLCEIIVRRAESYVRFGYDGDGLMTSAEGATGLVNFRMRWYDPVTGRWLSKDPIGLSGGLNLYSGFYNNAINFMDAQGEFATVIEGAVAAAVVTIAAAAAAVAATQLAQALSRHGTGCRGERGWTSRPDGTPNPGKKYKPTPDGGWEYKDQNGKKHKKPAGFDPNRGG